MVITAKFIVSSQALLLISRDLTYPKQFELSSSDACSYSPQYNIKTLHVINRLVYGNMLLSDHRVQQHSCVSVLLFHTGYAEHTSPELL